MQKQQPARPFRLLVIYLSYAAIHASLSFATEENFIGSGGPLYKMQMPSWKFADSEKIHLLLNDSQLLIMLLTVMICTGLKMSFRYRLIGIVIIVLVNWAYGYFGILVPQQPGFSSNYLDLIPLVALPLLIVLFRLAKLAYLFP